MDFALDETQTMIRDTMRQFAQSRVKPRAAEIDATEQFPWDLVAAMRELQLFGMVIPQEYGGTALDTLSYLLTIEEISRACMSTSTIVCGHNSIVAQPIVNFGSADQKERFLPKMATGEWLGAYALTEPNSGSDAGAMATTAVRQGDEYVINGNKVFITNGSVCGVVVGFATVDKGKGTKGVTAFIITPDMPGFKVGAREHKMGLCGSDTVELVFEDLHVPVENRLGTEGEGFKIALNTLDYGRIGIAAQSVGLGQAALDEALEYAKNRIQFGQPIGKFQAIQWKLADMATQLHAARLMTWYAGWAKDHGGRFTQESSMAKLYASEACARACNSAVQVFGGYGYSREYTVERLYRDARIVELYEGTSEIQRLVIARNLGL